MKSAEEIVKGFHELGWLTEQQSLLVMQIIKDVREEMREECARIALNEPRVLDHNAPDPQHRIEAKIRAIKNE